MKPLHQRSQWIAFTFASACAVLVLLIAVRVRHLPAPHQLGWRAYLVVDYRPVPRWLAIGLEWLGTATPFTVCVALVIGTSLALRDRFVALIALVGPMVALVLAEVGKPLVGRYEGRVFGFPSGHTTAFAAVVTVVAMVVHRRWGFRRSWAASLALALLSAVMTDAVVRSHRHVMSDAIAGDLLGVGAVLGSAWLLSVLVVRLGTSSRTGRTGRGWASTSLGCAQLESLSGSGHGQATSDGVG